MPLWQTNIRRRTPKPGPNFKPGESTIWPLTINTLQKNKQIPEIWTYRISAMLWASSPWINKGVPAMKCHKWPEQIMHIDATGAYGFASLRRTSTSNCGKHQLWAVVWYKDSCWPASTCVNTWGTKNSPHRCHLCHGVLHRLGSTCGDGSHQRRLSHLLDKTLTFLLFFTFLMARCTLGMKRLELPQKRPEKCSFHRLSSSFNCFRLSSFIHKLKKCCEYSVESLQSTEPILPCFQFSFLKMWLLYKLSHQRWAYPNR